VAYWDTSAIVKLYIPEADSPFFLTLITSNTDMIVSSAIAVPEALWVFHRKERDRALRRGGAKRLYRIFQSDLRLGRIVTVPFSHDVQAEADKLVPRAFAQKNPILIRTLDVIHVATALHAGTREFISTDARMREVASLVGLSLVP